MENKGFSLIVGLSIALHAVVLYAWTGPMFKPPVVDLVVGEMSVALAPVLEKPVEEPVEKVEPPVEEPAEVVEEPVEEPAEVVEEPVEEPAEVVEESVEEPVEESAEVVEEPVEEPAEVVKEIVEEPVEEPAEVVEEPVEVQPVALPTIGVRTEPQEPNENEWENKPPLYPVKRVGFRKVRRKEFDGRSIVLEIEVLVDGSVGQVRVLQGCGGDGIAPKVAEAVEKSVLEVVRGWRFHPGRVDGELLWPKASFLQHTIEFKLREDIRRPGAFLRD